MRRCPVCGFEAPETDGPVHAYLTHSPECWARFNDSMALHYSDIAYWSAHQLLVDAYALQHSPGSDRRAIQSAGLHLAALVHAFENTPVRDDEAVRVRKGLSGRDDLFELVEPYPTASMTIGSVVTDEGPEAHLVSVQAYARAVYEDWAAHRPVARKLIAGAIG